MNTKRPEEGDIVQLRGQGRGMQVVADNFGSHAHWQGIPDAIVCAWEVDGVTHREGYAAGDLEVVGSQRRQSHTEIYEWVTTGAIATITTLAAQGQHGMAQGAMRLWSELTGTMARDEDRLRLQQLIDRIGDNRQ
ncbi:hypothetical protein [Duganella sp. HH101]|uniref:hypothetical protein n=1 Tax=Duganella sp. HH101 TaxID=1781066 RepID=UPI00087486CE|nr:hypothetical protein [Duganella sp. HH101]OFA00179.1 hypothetical protein DUGA2_50120 [Duganella sp. HH101]